MPFIDSKVSVKVTQEQRTELKQRLGKAIAPDHMYIKYSASMDWGWNGSNF